MLRRRFMQNGRERMMRFGRMVLLFAGITFLFASVGLTGCHVDTFAEHSLTAAQQQTITNDVRSFMNEVAQDVTQNGVTAWRKHFEDSPAFFMAVNGALAFPDSQSFTQGMPKLASMFKHIELTWGNGVRVDPLSVSFATVASLYHEKLTDADGHVMQSDGFFTALAEKRGGQWQFRNVHWSVPPAPTNH
jgi:hypothetical protein